MSRTLLRWAIPGVAAFLMVLVARIPAAWFRSLLPSPVSCAVVEGTLWRGSCAGLHWQAKTGSTVALDKMSWSLRPAALLRGRLAARVQLLHAGGEATAEIRVGPHTLIVDSLTGRVPVDHQLLPLIPVGWRADLAARDLAITLDAGNMARLAGTALVHQIIDSENDSLGSYELTLGKSAGPPFVGQLRDSGGPLALAGTMRIEARGAWQVDGRVTPRASASAGLTRQVRLLGLPAADGSYPFSIAGE